MERIQADADERVSEAIKQSEENATASESEKISALQEDFAIKMSEMQQSHQQELEKIIAHNDVVISDLRTSLLSEKAEALESLRTEFSSSMDFADENVAQFESQVLTLSSEISQLKHELDDKDGSHSTTVTLLQDDLKAARDSIENLAHEHQAELVRLQEDRASISDEELNKKIDDIKSEYDQKIEKLEGQKSKALELAKKVKEAAQTKLSNAALEKAELSKKLEDMMSRFDEEKQGIAHEVESQKSMLDSIVKEHEAAIAALNLENEKKLSESLENSKSAEEASEAERKQLLEKILSLQQSAVEASDGVANQRAQLVDEIKASYEDQIEKMNADHEGKRRESLEKLKLKFNEKLKAAITEHESTKASLQEKMTQHTDELKLHFETKVNKMKEELEGTKSNMEVEKAEMEQKLKLAVESASSINEDKSALHDQLKAQMVSAATLTNQLDAARQNLSNVMVNSESTTTSLLQEQEKMVSQQAQLQNQISLLKNELSSKNNQFEEMNGKLLAFQDSLNTVSSEKNELERKFDAASKQVAKLNATEEELGKSREQLNRFKLELSQNSALLSRLKAEQESSEKTHGQRTALVGMLETQLSELNETNAESQAKFEAALYDLGQKDDDLNMAKEENDKLQKDLLHAQNQIQSSRRASIDQKSQNAAEQDLLRKAKLAESLQREMHSLQQQMAKKSVAAQKLLQKRESDCQEMKKRIKTLQQELDKGSLSDRRIFEIAAQQSNRESVASSEISIRNLMVENLATKLQENDSDLATAEYAKKKAERQVEDLCRIHRREDINLDYLKGTVVQFLSKPPASSERGALLPVIATLLQFDAEDYKLIEEGKTKVSWFGSVLPTIISAPLAQHGPGIQSNVGNQGAPLLSGSAEVTVSNPTTPKPANRTLGTSLQF